MRVSHDSGERTQPTRRRAQNVFDADPMECTNGVVAQWAMGGGSSMSSMASSDRVRSSITASPVSSARAASCWRRAALITTPEGEWKCGVR